jgi:hypothetical protein
MGCVESWVYRRADGAVVWHVENDGPRVLRHGTQAAEEVVTSANVEMLKSYPRDYEDAKRLLADPEAK